MGQCFKYQSVIQQIFIGYVLNTVSRATKHHYPSHHKGFFVPQKHQPCCILCSICLEHLDINMIWYTPQIMSLSKVLSFKRSSKNNLYKKRASPIPVCQALINFPDLLYYKVLIARMTSTKYLLPPEYIYYMTVVLYLLPLPL